MNFRSNFFSFLCGLAIVASVCFVGEVSSTNCDACDKKCSQCTNPSDLGLILKTIGTTCTSNCMPSTQPGMCTSSITGNNPMMQSTCPSTILTLAVSVALSLSFLIKLVLKVKASLIAALNLIALVKVLTSLGCTKDKLLGIGIDVGVLAGLGLRK